MEDWLLGVFAGTEGGVSYKLSTNKTNVISADLLDFDFDFEDIIIMFGNISVLVTF